MTSTCTICPICPIYHDPKREIFTRLTKIDNLFLHERSTADHVVHSRGTDTHMSKYIYIYIYVYLSLICIDIYWSSSWFLWFLYMIYGSSWSQGWICNITHPAQSSQNDTPRRWDPGVFAPHLLTICLAQPVGSGCPAQHARTTQSRIYIIYIIYIYYTWYLVSIYRVYRVYI